MISSKRLHVKPKEIVSFIETLDDNVEREYFKIDNWFYYKDQVGVLQFDIFISTALNKIFKEKVEQGLI